MNKRVVTRINHVLGRLSRFVTTTDPDGKIREYKEDQSLIVGALDETRLEILERAQNESEDVSEVGQVNQAGAVAKLTPVHKWGITFEGKAVNSFIQRIEEIRIARRTTKEELFRSAFDLFQGQALVWFRSVKSSVHTWDALVKALRRDFLPPDYDEELWREIRNRTQGQQERVTFYVAAMLNLFSRLSERPTEEVQLRTIKRNLRPNFQTQIALTDARSVSKLTEVCRKLEGAFECQQKFQPPPRRSIALLEPDLAYTGTENVGQEQPSTSRNEDRRYRRSYHTAQIGELTCFGCKKLGHFIRDCPQKITRKGPVCIGCGKQGVIRPNCPNCSKN